MGNRDQSQLEQDIRNFMSDKNHSPFYSIQEIEKGVNYKEPRFKLVSEFSGILAGMQCRHIITTGSASAPDKYVLQERMDQYLKEHEGQIL
jgi:hypothetical protein